MRKEQAKMERSLKLPEDEELLKMKKSWGERLSEKAEKRGFKLGEREGERRGEREGELRGASRAKRETLLAQMREKFGPLPRGVAVKVSAIGHPRRLDALLRRVVTAPSLHEMGLR
ncbi:MAG: hypothetical protein HYZ53_25240 [Planctomycetes bacterium]|nr:hypothetical protein [Planctomycetota bacterium]